MSSRLFCRLLLFFLCTSTIPIAQAEKDISAHKVAYLYYFSKFVSWPQDTFTDSENINLCVGEISEAMKYQLSTVEGKRIGNYSLRTISILKDTTETVNNKNISPELLTNCHLLYVNEQMLNWFQQHSKQIPTHTLTVANELSQEIDSVIYLFIKDKRLTFEINNKLASAKGIKISSKLLKLSRERKKP